MSAAADIAVYRGIRYATADRFGAPVRVDGAPIWSDEPGPIAPQLPSRLETVMGKPNQLPQSEDCLRLTITAPKQATGRPVLIWIHGGAYLTGSGGFDWYDAGTLVRETGIVVVSINYRLGALGYLRAPGRASGNLGLLDQITAIEWVRDHIAEFGGDPQSLTVAGQSAGAHSIFAMLGSPRTRGLFRRAILQSVPTGIAFPTPAQAERVGQIFLDVLGTDPHSAPLSEILRAQGETARQFAEPDGLSLPFLPISGLDPLPEADAWRAEIRDRAADLRLVVGSTAHEMAAFLGPDPTAELAQSLGREIFEEPLAEFADDLARAGAHLHRYRVDALHPDNPFGACHCIELPLLFGDENAWGTAPMLSGLPLDTLADLGAPMRRAWGEFVTTGVIADWEGAQPHRLP
ncbi:carboxylesterase/lipase family protein [Nocardia panacis]|uniref:Carboxylic ester hydrolase n=1 Tax=Nocardia panacis TaxID=2340916 RepID=A0A3A4KNB6_9NOCA|nr:carboxylesterase family protein [Nocardia panacis]RJO75616.1 carboxylesterase/lipase family protein [Nocardia panacis]